jgi:transcriptional regulator with XRE-family HTH domain
MKADHPLRVWRSCRGLTQEAAARELNLKKPTLSRYETGSRIPSLARAAKLSQKTGIPIDKFVAQAEAAE